MGRPKENVHLCPICKHHRAALAHSSLFGMDVCAPCQTLYQREVTCTLATEKEMSPDEWLNPFDPSPLTYAIQRDKAGRLTFAKRMLKQRGLCRCGAELKRKRVYLSGTRVLRSLHCHKCHLARIMRNPIESETPKTHPRKPLTTKDILARLPWPWLLSNNPFIMKDLEHGV